MKALKKEGEPGRPVSRGTGPTTERSRPRGLFSILGGLHHGPMDHHDGLQGFLEELALRELRPTSLAKYRQQLLSYHAWLGEREPSPQAAREYLAALRDKGLMPQSVLHYSNILRQYHDWRGEPLKLRLRKPKTLPPYVAQGNVERLIAAAYQGSSGQRQEIRQRNGCALELMAFAGLRRGEVLDLRVGDVDFDRAIITVLHGKGDKPRVIPMAGRLVIPLRQLCQGQSGRARVIRNLNGRRLHDLVRRLGQDIGWDDPTPHPHLLRHRFATALLETSANLKEVQELMGHERLESTAGYLSLTQAHLRSAIDRLDSSPVAQEGAAFLPPGTSA